MFKLFGKRALLALTFASTITTVIAEKPSGPWQNQCYARASNGQGPGKLCKTAQNGCERGDDVICEIKLCPYGVTWGQPHNYNACDVRHYDLNVPNEGDDLFLCFVNGYAHWYERHCP